MIYTIAANDEVLGKDKLRKLLAKESIKSDIMNTVEYDCESADIDNIIEYCNTTPFFSDRKTVILKRPIFLTSERTSKDYTEFIDKLMAYMEDDNKETNLIIFSTYENIDNKKKIVKYLKENTNYMVVAKPDKVAMNVLVKNMVNKRDAEISDKAIEVLVEKVGDRIQDLTSEIDKLTTYKPHGIIQEDDVLEFVTVSLDAKVFDLSNAVLAKDTTQAYTLFEHLTNVEKIEPIMLIITIANQFRRSLLAKTYKSQGKSNEQIAKILKCAPGSIYYALKLKYSEEDIKKNILRLAEIDYNIISGKANKYHALKLYILSI